MRCIRRDRLISKLTRVCQRLPDQPIIPTRVLDDDTSEEGCEDEDENDEEEEDNEEEATSDED